VRGKVEAAGSCRIVYIVVLLRKQYRSPSLQVRAIDRVGESCFASVRVVESWFGRS
jgi:hypothetical protein